MLSSLDELAAFLEESGFVVRTHPQDEVVIAPFGEGRLVVIRWRAVEKAVEISCSTGVCVTNENRLPGVLFAVAKMNQQLDEPGLVVHVDDGHVEYRARLFATSDGRLDEDILVRELHAAVRCVLRAAPEIRAVLEVKDATAVLEAAAPFAGYME